VAQGGDHSPFHTRSIQNLGGQITISTSRRYLPARPIGFPQKPIPTDLKVPLTFLTAQELRETNRSSTAPSSRVPSRAPSPPPSVIASQIPQSPHTPAMATPTFTEAQVQDLIARAIAQAGLHRGPTGPPGPQGQQGEQGQRGESIGGNGNGNNLTWKIEELGYFNPNLPDPKDQPIKTVGSQTHYRDVYVFVDRLKDLASIKGEELVKTNVHASLRGSALDWYATELNDMEKGYLRMATLELGWSSCLIKRFKPRVPQALNRITETKFGFSDINAGTSPRAFAQTMLRYTKAAVIDSVYNQLSLIWSRMDMDLRKDIPEPTENTTIAEFITDLEAREDIWKEQASRRQNRNQAQGKNPGFSQGNRNTTGTTLAQRRPFRPNPRPFNNQSYNQPYRMANPMTFPQNQNVYTQGYGQQPNAYYPQFPPYMTQNPYTKYSGTGQYQYPPRPPQRPWYPPPGCWNQGQTTRQNPQPSPDQKQLGPPPQQLMISDKPANPPRNNGFNNGSKNTPALNRGPTQPWARSQTAYHGEVTGESQVKSTHEWIPDEGHHDEYSIPGDEYQEQYNGDEFPDYEQEFTSEEPLPDETEYAADAFLLSTVKNPFSCHHCTEDFPSKNSLHSHVKKHHKKNPESLQNHEPLLHEVIHSSKQYEGTAGYAFRPWRYATTRVSLNESPTYIEACLDTGCTMTVINKSFAQTLGITPKQTSPISLSGIGSKHESSEYAIIKVDIPARIGARQVLARLSVEAHLIDKLAIRLLLGADVLAAEGISLNLDEKRGHIGSCQGAEFDIKIRTKPNHQLSRPVLTAKAITIPPHHEGHIPVKLKSQLLADRDFLFEPTFDHLTLYTHAVDTDFTFVQAQNKSNNTTKIPRNTRLGTLSDMDLVTAFQVDASAAEMAARKPAVSISDSLKVEGPTTILENGMTIYGTGQSAKRLEALVGKYDIWRDKGEFVDIPMDQWMRIPLVEGWEKSVQKNSVYPSPGQDKTVIDEKFDKLHAQGRLSWANTHTPSGYPVFVAWRTVNKPDGTRQPAGRPVVDLRGLNKRVEPDIYPIPTQQEIIQMVAGCQYISVVDAISFFYQWRIHPEDRRHMAVLSHRGQEIFNVPIMGYTNSVQYVQRQIDNILRDCRSFCRAYIDDILIASKTLEEHEEHLDAVFSRLEARNVCLGPEKAFIGFPSIQLLGQRFDSLGLATLDSRIKAISALKFPNTLKQLETYLGMTGALRHYIEGYAWKTQPLQDRKTFLLEGSPVKGNPRRKFTDKTLLSSPSDKEMEAFENLQKEFTSPKFLHHHDPAKQMYIDMDSSKERGHGAMIYHLKDTYYHKDMSKPPSKTAVLPILFLSRTLTPAEQNYWPTELEVSGLVWVIKKVRHLIESSPLDKPTVIYTDHSSSADLAKQTTLKTTSAEKLNLRLIRASQYMQQFRLRVIHRPGKTNSIADALSRLPTKTASAENNPTDLDALLYHVSLVEMSPEFQVKLQEGYKVDRKLARILKMLEQEDQKDDPKKTKLPYYLENNLLYTTSKDVLRLCIPSTLIKEVFEMAHDNSGHQGFARTYEKLQGLAIQKASHELRKYIKACPHCAQFITHRHKLYGSLQPIIPPPIPFHTITIDFIMALPLSSEGYDQNMIVTDKFTKRNGIIPGKSTWTAEEWGVALIRHLQTTDWGYPKVIISDRDRKFLSGIWKGIFAALGTQLVYSAAYHPQTDGQSERSNATIEIIFRHLLAICPEAITNWPILLPSLHEILNSTTNAATEKSPHELMYGMRLNTGVIHSPEAAAQDFSIRDDAYEAMKFASMYMKEVYDKKHKDIHFDIGDQVYLTLHKGYDIPETGILGRKLSRQRVGPFKVIERIGKLAYRIDLRLIGGFIT
jgi:hypothetical protein